MRARIAVLLIFATATSCGPSISGGDPDASEPLLIDGAVGQADARRGGIDASADATIGNIYDDADVPGNDGGALCDDTTCLNPVADGCVAADLCGDDGSGDGLDNDCNGKVDDTCHCIPGDVKACFVGPPGRRGVGACQDGSMRCEGSGELGKWGACEGGIAPKSETCDNLDNNCNGCADDNPECCDVDLHCPDSADMPIGAPFSDYIIDGTAYFNGIVTSWTWTVKGGPCDQLLSATSGKTSFTLTGQNTSTLTFHPTLSGDYTVHMKAIGADGNSYECEFIVHVRGPGLRVELCWDKTGSTDLDLHLHKPGTTTPWFATQSECDSASCYNNDDCYFANCKANPYPSPPGITSPSWGYANSPIDVCSGGPEGSQWSSVGYCRNPRLDIDNVSTPGVPENINVDTPATDGTYRVMVHYYSPLPESCFIFGNVVVHPMVNIYCGGYLKATYGASPDVVPGFTCGGSFRAGPMWRVADVTTTGTDAMGNTECDIKALHPGAATSGYNVTQDNATY